MKPKLSDDMKRLTLVKPVHVACPVCAKMPPSKGFKSRWGLGQPMVKCFGPSRRMHTKRYELAKRVTAILRAAFEVAERPCNGEAHSNPHIDHCMVCLPRWGVVCYLVPKKAPTPTG